MTAHGDADGHGWLGICQISPARSNFKKKKKRNNSYTSTPTTHPIYVRPSVCTTACTRREGRRAWSVAGWW